jgi:hypothetical protein
MMELSCESGFCKSQLEHEQLFYAWRVAMDIQSVTSYNDFTIPIVWVVEDYLTSPEHLWCAPCFWQMIVSHALVFLD